MIPFLVLIVINLIILFMIREPENFAEVKKRYKILREHIEKTDNEKFSCVDTSNSLDSTEEDVRDGGLQCEQRGGHNHMYRW